MPEQLYFQELVILWVMMMNDPWPLTHRMAVIAVNRWVESRGVPPNYSLPMAYSRRQWSKSIGVLMRAGLVLHPSPRSGYRASEKSEALFSAIGTDWHEWPLSIPVVKDNIQLDKAVFAKDFRSAL